MKCDGCGCYVGWCQCYAEEEAVRAKAEEAFIIKYGAFITGQKAAREAAEAAEKPRRDAALKVAAEALFKDEEEAAARIAGRWMPKWPTKEAEEASKWLTDITFAPDGTLNRRRTSWYARMLVNAFNARGCTGCCL